MANLDTTCRWCRSKVSEQEMTKQKVTRWYLCGTYVVAEKKKSPVYTKLCGSHMP